jgi:hypothetical protein
MRVVKKSVPPLYDSAIWTIAGDTPDDPVSLEQGPNGEQYGILHAHDNQFRVNDGDVILRAVADGSLSVMNPRDFAEQFEPYDMADKVNKQPSQLPKASKADK